MIDSTKVVLLGFDGQDPTLTERLMSEGKLPHFAKLAKAGGYARFATTNPAQSPVAWTTLATGAGPGYHGVFDFLKSMPERMLVDLAVHRMVQGKGGAPDFERVRQVDAFWDITSAAGLHTSVIRWPVTFPAEKVTGEFISGLGTPDILGRLGKYTFYQLRDPAADDEAPEKVQKLQQKADHWVGQLEGPKVAGLLRTHTSTVEFELRTGDGGGATLQLPDSEPVQLQLGEWSPWLSVSFDVGRGRTVSAIFKCVLMGSGDDCRMYTSPLEIDPRDPAFDISHPAEYARYLVTGYGLFHTLGMPEDTNGVTDRRFGRDQFLATCEEVMQEREFMLDEQLATFDEPGVVAVVFDTSDRIQHLFWAAVDRDHPIADADWQSEWSGIIESSYRHQDEILGNVLEQADDDTIVMVFSDHGFTTFRRAVHLNYWLTREGYMDAELGTEDQAGTLFKTVNWRDTVAYACGFGGVYLNLKGRESQGIVDPGAEASRLREEIAERMSQMVDEEVDGKPIREVFTRDQIFAGPLQDRAPDLFVGCERGYRASWQTAIGGGLRTLIEVNDDPWCGDHLMHPELVPGILFANRPLTADNPNAYDIAPTVLRCLGLDVPDTVAGQPVIECE